MVEASYGPRFRRIFSRIRERATKEKITRLIVKIIHNPEIGKPMMHGRKGTREVYMQSYRLSYSYIKDRQEVVFLDVYHKNHQ
jgi:mRNA-degrading endonuclease RelE of RelBE toxin-antitoxin system